MPFHDVQQMMDSKSAAVVEQKLLHVIGTAFTDIVDGTDIRDKASSLVNTEGADMDAIARDRVTQFGEPVWVSKGQNKKPRVNEATDREIYQNHELVLCAAFTRKELRQAAKTNTPLQADRVSNVKESMELAMRDALVKGVPKLGLPGFFSNVNKLMHSQVTTAFKDMTDQQLEDWFIKQMQEYEEENGSNFPIKYIWLAPSIHSRFLRSKGTDGSGPSMKKHLCESFDLDHKNWISDSRLSRLTLGAAANKATMMFLPSNQRIVTIHQPVRWGAEEPYKDGSDLVLEFYQQFAGVQIHEKLPTASDL